MSDPRPPRWAPSLRSSVLNGGLEKAVARKLAAQLAASLGLPAPSQDPYQARGETAGC